MNDLQLSELKAASFVNGIKRYNQTFLIVELIKRCIRENKRITMDEIKECYLQQMFPHEHSVKLGWYKSEWNDLRRNYLFKEEYFKNDRINTVDNKAKNWFMTNLGAAIIKGKLLVIPIIDIEQKYITP